MFLRNRKSIQLKMICLFFFLGHKVFALNVLVKAQTRQLQSNLLLSATIQPAKSESVKVGWNTMLTGIHVKLGQAIKAGDMIATSNVDYLAQEKNYIKANLESLVLWKKNLQVDFELIKKKQVSMNELASKNLIPKVEAEKVQLAIIDGQKALFSADSSLKSTQARLNEIEELIRQANYYSPISGIVSSLLVDPRQFTGMLQAEYGSVLAIVNEPRRFVAVVNVMDTQFLKIKKGQRAQIQIEGEQDFYNGIVTELSTEANPKTQLFPVKVEFRKEGEPIPSGITGRVIFNDGAPRKTLALPWNAIRIEGDGAWVVPLEKYDGKNQESIAAGSPRRVTIGMRTADHVEILEGLKEGDWVEASLW